MSVKALTKNILIYCPVIAFLLAGFKSERYESLLAFEIILYAAIWSAIFIGWITLVVTAFED